MLNIMKSQVYQLLRDRIMWFIIIVVFLANIILLVDQFELQTTGSEITAYAAGTTFIISNIITLVVVANVMGKDFMDKTLNYEIMSGHKRSEVFFGRMVVAMLAGPILSVIAMIVAPAIFTALFGWGNSMDLGDVAFRYLLVYINQLRIACEVILITIITKNAYLSYIVGYLFAMVSFFFTTMTVHQDISATPLLSIYHGSSLLVFNDWSTFFLNETDQMFYTAETSLEMILTTVLLTTIVGSILTFISYFYFKKDDLN